MVQDLSERIHRAREAEEFLSNPLVKGLVLSAKERYFTQWANTAPDETAKREALHAQYRGLLALINELRGFIVDGKQIKFNEERKDGGEN